MESQSRLTRKKIVDQTKHIIKFEFSDTSRPEKECSVWRENNLYSQWATTTDAPVPRLSRILGTGKFFASLPLNEGTTVRFSALNF